MKSYLQKTGCVPDMEIFFIIYLSFCCVYKCINIAIRRTKYLVKIVPNLLPKLAPTKSMLVSVYVHRNDT